MKEIEINGVIGGGFFASGVTSRYVKEQLDAVQPGEEIKIVIDSPGGDFFEMVPIFNVIRNFARKNPQQIETYIQGKACSAASMIALAAKAGNPNNIIKVEDNSIFMIHNCWSICDGDHRVFEKETVQLRRVDELQRDIYARQTRAPREELTKMMDEDTFLYGAEIKAAGFADEVIETENIGEDTVDTAVFSSQKAARIISAKTALNEIRNIRVSALHHDAKSIAAAMAEVGTYAASVSQTESQEYGTGTTNVSNRQEDEVTEEELKQKNPEVYAQILKAGIQTERERVMAHVKMATDSGDVCAAVEFIQSGAHCSDNTVIAKYHEIFTKTALAKARASDTVPDTQTLPENESSDTITAAAFEKETGLRV